MQGHSKLSASASKLPSKIKDLYLKHGEKITKALKEKHSEYGTTIHDMTEVYAQHSDQSEPHMG